MLVHTILCTFSNLSECLISFVIPTFFFRATLHSFFVWEQRMVSACLANFHYFIYNCSCLPLHLSEIAHEKSRAKSNKLVHKNRNVYIFANCILSLMAHHHSFLSRCFLKGAAKYNSRDTAFLVFFFAFAAAMKQLVWNKIAFEFRDTFFSSSFHAASADRKWLQCVQTNEKWIKCCYDRAQWNKIIFI